MGGYGVCCALCNLDCKLKLAFCHLGQDNWCGLKLESKDENCDHIYLNGMLFSVETDTGITKVTDITAGSLAYVVPPVEGNSVHGSVYLMEASGDILGVCQHCNWLGGFVYNFWFDIQQMDVNKSGPRCCVKVKDIGNHALFIDWNGGFILMADDFSGIKANCIYQLKSICVRSHERPLYEVERIDLETDARERFPCPFKRPASWFTPKLHHL